jgi:hypothetical protein
MQANLLQAPGGQYSMVPGWDQQSLASAFSTVSLNQPQNTDWYFDSGATSHMTSDAGTLSSTSVPCFPAPSSIVVGNGSFMPVTATGATILSPLRLNNVLVSLGMKTIGNGRENPLPIPVPVFSRRERERERERRTGKRNRYYGISGTEQLDRKHIDYDREHVQYDREYRHVTT